MDYAGDAHSRRVEQEVKLPGFGRRRFLYLAAGVPGVGLSASGLCLHCSMPAPPPTESTTYQIPEPDMPFLEDLSRRTFQYFWEKGDAHTGLILDRARTDGSSDVKITAPVASIAATGFGLTALCIGARQRWVTREDARQRMLTTLHFFAERAPSEHGWFYHFLDARTGARVWNCELSSIDTALLLAGILTARQYFHEDSEIGSLASLIYRRVDFQWMLNGDRYLLAMGWFPEKGFIPQRWDHYCELMILYLLAIASPTHPIPAAAWYAWSRPPITYDGFHYIYGDRPLFVHQFAHAWIDFRGRRESRPPHIDWFQNSITATRAQRGYCLHLHEKFPGYGEDVWGITASDSARGYIAWGGPPDDPRVDGTVVPCAPAGSLMFTPRESLAGLRKMKELYGERIYGRYGFADAFNPNTGWVDSDVIGIDLGITLLSVENLLTGKVWRWFMSNPEMPRALDLVGLRKD